MVRLAFILLSGLAVTLLAVSSADAQSSSRFRSLVGELRSEVARNTPRQAFCGANAVRLDRVYVSTYGSYSIEIREIQNGSGVDYRFDMSKLDKNRLNIHVNACPDGYRSYRVMMRCYEGCLATVTDRQGDGGSDFFNTLFPTNPTSFAIEVSNEPAAYRIQALLADISDEAYAIWASSR